MKTFKVYFIVFGKKLCVKIKADTKRHAESKVLSKIEFCKTEEVDPIDEIHDLIDEIHKKYINDK